MKNLLVTLVILLMTLGLSAAIMGGMNNGSGRPDDVVITAPLVEGFESGTFPPAGWVSETSIGSEGYDLELQTIDPVNPTIYDTPHGNKWVRLESKPEAHNSVTLWTPRIDFPAGNEFYQITISRYVTNVTTNDRFSYIQVHRSSTPGVSGQMMGQVWNKDFSNPDVGWRDETVYLGFLGGTSQYISLYVSDWLDDVNFDNIRIEVGSPWHPAYPFPANNSTDLAVNTWFGWGHYMMHGGTYSLHLSTDNVNFTSRYEGVYDSIDSLAVRLEGNTTYYWYVVASEYGNTVTSPTWSFTTRGITFPYTESFESGVFPPNGWILMPEYGQPNLTLETNNPETPSIYDTPYGNNWVSLQSDPATTNDAVMWSPRFNFPEGDSFYQIKMSRYITNTSYSNVQVNMGPTLYTHGPALAQFSNMDEPASVGWHDYSGNLGFVGGTSQYMALTVTNFNEAPHFDNIRIEEGSPWSNIYPPDGAEISDLNPMLNWGEFWSSSNLYTLYVSMDNINFSPEYIGPNNEAFLNNQLTSGTTYYWHVVASGDGYGVSSPVWSFTMGDAVIPEGVIVEFPYLADFQLEDPLWQVVPLGKNASSGKLDAAKLNKIPLLQKHSSTMSKDREGVWERVPDGEANYAFKLLSGVESLLFSPILLLSAGETYEIKYNYRQSVPTTPSEVQGIVLVNFPQSSDPYLLDEHIELSNTEYALRMVTLTPETTDYYIIAFMGVSPADIYVDNFRITQNGDDLLTASAPTVDGVSTPDPSPIYNTVTQMPLDTELHIANITGTPEITATVSWSPPIVGSQNSGLKLNLHTPGGGLAGASVTFIHNLGYAPMSASYRIVPNGFTTVSNPYNGSWTTTQCVFTVPAGKADGDYEVILQLSNEQTLAVEFSSFSATVTQQNYVLLNWVTQSETGVVGYYIYRSTTNNVESAEIVSSLITAYNTSQQQAYNYTDEEVEPGSWYYWIQNVDMNGQSGFHGSISVVVQEPEDGDTPVIPLVTSMQNIYPNPFNPSTTIAFGVDKAEHVTIQIYNVKGQFVRNLISETKQANTYRLVWNGTNDSGKPLPSGIYYAKMTAGQYTATRKLVIMK